jgi:hypothetical protein
MGKGMRCMREVAIEKFLRNDFGEIEGKEGR